jgi:hypothetical protein
MNMVYWLVHVVALSTKIGAAGMYFFYLGKLSSSVILDSNLSIVLAAACFFFGLLDSAARMDFGCSVWWY